MDFGEHLLSSGAKPSQNSASRERQVLARNALFSSFSWMASVVSNLLTIPIMVYFLGREGYGVYALLTGLFGYFSLMDLGMGQGVVKYVSQYSGMNDPVAMNHLINASLLAQLGLGSLGVILLWTFNEAIVDLLNVSEALRPDARTGLYVSSVGFLVTMLMANYSNALQGLQCYDLVGKANLILSLSTTLATIIALVLGVGLTEIIWISLAGTVSTSIVLVLLLKRAFPKYRFSWKVPFDYLKLLTTFGNYMLISRVAHILNTYFVRYIVAVFLGPAAVTLVLVPTKLLSFLQGGINSLAAVVLPFASRYISQDHTEEFRLVYLRASKVLTSLFLPLFIYLIVYSKEILTIWMGPDFAEDAWIVQVLLGFTYLLSAFTILPTNTILGIGQLKVVAYFAVGTVVTNLATCAYMVARFGVIGAAVAVLCTQVFALPFVWYVTTRQLSIPWKTFLRESVQPATSLSLWFLAFSLVALVLFRSLAWGEAIPPLVFGMLLIGAYLFAARKRGLVPSISIHQLIRLYWPQL